MMKAGTLKFIGIVKSSGEVSEVEVYPEYCNGLYRLEEFSHVMIFYWLHLRDNQADRSTLRVIPKRHPGAPEVGVFASRSPSRPNPVGFSVVELIRVKDCKMVVRGLDAFEGSPIIDIKPYIPRADSVPKARAPNWTLSGPPT
ncbi:MAG: tRNA (N6-threonylcarbamoyladenosine(37)-N6)-methyltransferase TrmO [Candidatus Bathyarchaeia archaeon]